MTATLTPTATPARTAAAVLLPALRAARAQGATGRISAAISIFFMGASSGTRDIG